MNAFLISSVCVWEGAEGGQPMQQSEKKEKIIKDIT